MTSVALWLIGAAVVGTFAVLFAWDRTRTSDSREAASRTTNRLLSAFVGIGGVLAAILVEGLDVISELPGAAITILGVGSLLGGISPEVFLAVAVTTIIVLGAIREEGI